jgi:hypothetical protein
MNSFVKGIIIGAAGMLVLVLVIAGFRFFNERDKQIYEYMERQNEIQAIEQDVRDRDPYEFLDTPGVRGAADSATEEFNRKRDEAIRAIRQRRIAK